MGNSLKVLVLIAALLTVSFGVIDSQAARKHRHTVKMRYLTGSKVLPPGNDPATSGVESAAIRCPRGYRITGGSYKVDTIAFVPTAHFESSRTYGIIAVNNVDDQRGTMRLTIACVKTRTGFKRASSGPSLAVLEERLREQRRRARD